MSTEDQQPLPHPPGFGASGAAPHGTPPPAPQPKKGWMRRHKILTGILGAVVLFGLIGALSGEDPAPTSATQTSAEPTQAPAEEGAGSSASSQGSTADESAADAEKKAAEEKAAKEKKAAEEKAAKEKEEAEKAPAIGDTVTIGDFEATVTGVEDGIDYVGPQDWGEAAQGQFVKVTVSVKNTGSSAEMFFDSEQKLIDEQDREHSTSNAAIYLDEDSLWLKDINPGNTATGALLFDIPTDASPTGLKLSSGFFGDTAMVSLKN